MIEPKCLEGRRYRAGRSGRDRTSWWEDRAVGNQVKEGTEEGLRERSRIEVRQLI